MADPLDLVDPIPVADDALELLHRADWSGRHGQLMVVLRSAGPALGGVVAEIARRGYLARLLPTAPSTESAELVGLLLTIDDDAPLTAIAQTLVDRGGDYDRYAMNEIVERAAAVDALPGVFAQLIASGRYDRTIKLLCSDGTSDSSALRALAAARPQYGAAELNAAPLEGIRRDLAAGAFDAYAYELIIVPGFTPVDARKAVPLASLPPARERLDAAANDFANRRAPYILVSGGAVHPPGTPYNEALMMRSYLTTSAPRPVPADRILVDPFARHSTTNLRNAARMMKQLGLSSGLVVTGYDNALWSQAFYFGQPELSTFHLRSEEQLGYVVGDLRGLDRTHVAFTPGDEVETPNYRDPLDA